jgi:hypothetical protein
MHCAKSTHPLGLVWSMSNVRHGEQIHSDNQGCFKKYTEILAILNKEAITVADVIFTK